MSTTPATARHLQARLCARLRRHCIEAPGVTLSRRPGRLLDKGKNLAAPPVTRGRGNEILLL